MILLKKQPGWCEQMIDFLAMALIPDVSGAIYIKAYDTLVVADLHFEKGSSLARFGVIVPPFDTRSTLDRLEDVIARIKPSRLVCLGDSFHDRHAPSRLEPDDNQRIKNIAADCDLIWITGNHDPELPPDLPGDVCQEMMLGDLTLRHEPSLKTNREICGHLHPAAVVRQRGRRLKRKCFAGNDYRLFLPAFGAYTGGLNVKSKAFEPYWNAKKFDVWMLGKNNIHKFPSRVLI